jgi:hypothetical protein
VTRTGYERPCLLCDLGPTMRTSSVPASRNIIRAAQQDEQWRSHRRRDCGVSLEGVASLERLCAFFHSSISLPQGETLRIRSAAFACLLMAGACGGDGPAPSASTGVISESRLSENVWTVATRSNPAAPSAVDATLLRSADLAIANGFAYFIIVDRVELTHGAAAASDTFEFREPGISNTIVGFNQISPLLSGLVYDAQFTHDRLTMQNDAAK